MKAKPKKLNPELCAPLTFRVLDGGFWPVAALCEGQLWVGSYLSPAAEIGQKQSFGDEDIGHCVL